MALVCFGVGDAVLCETLRQTEQFFTLEVFWACIVWVIVVRWHGWAFFVAHGMQRLQPVWRIMTVRIAEEPTFAMQFEVCVLLF